MSDLWLYPNSRGGAGNKKASRSEIIEALGIDYEAAAKVIMRRLPHPRWSHLARMAVDAALGLEEDE